MKDTPIKGKLLKSYGLGNFPFDVYVENRYEIRYTFKYIKEYRGKRKIRQKCRIL